MDCFFCICLNKSLSSFSLKCFPPYETVVINTVLTLRCTVILLVRLINKEPGTEITLLQSPHIYYQLHIHSILVCKLVVPKMAPSRSPLGGAGLLQGVEQRKYLIFFFTWVKEGKSNWFVLTFDIVAFNMPTIALFTKGGSVKREVWERRVLGFIVIMSHHFIKYKLFFFQMSVKDFYFDPWRTCVEDCKPSYTGVITPCSWVSPGFCDDASQGIKGSKIFELLQSGVGS